MDFYRQYDTLDGYREYGIRCKDGCHRWTDTKFEGQGVLPILNSEQCSIIQTMIDNEDPLLQEHQTKLEILNTILNPYVDEAMLSYFESEYIPIWMKFIRNVPGENSDKQVSFKWHLDGGPEHHLRILVYLNSAEESGGNTLILSRKTTFLLKRLGYPLCDIQQRTSDLSELCKLYNIPYKPVEANCKEGEALIFAPMAYLHRGVWPTKTPRYLIQICFTPSMMPWFDACIKHNAPLDKSTWPKVN